MEYDAIEAARHIATETTARAMDRYRQMVERAKGDPAIRPPIGFKYIDTAPFDGTFVRLRFRPGAGREDMEAVGQWKVMPDGFCGWWNRDGFHISPGPLFWAPEAGSIN